MAVPVSIDLTDEDVFTALRSFLMLVVPDIEVLREFDDQVPLPDGGFILMSPISILALATALTDYADTPNDPENSALLLKESTKCTVQIDFFGPDAMQWAKTFVSTFPSEWGCLQFGDNVKPLSCGEPKLLAIENGTTQYENRWGVTADLQYNPTVTVPMQYADEAEATLIEDETINIP